MKKLLSIAIIAVLSITLFALSEAKDKPSGDLVLTAKKVKSAPADADSPQWEKAKESMFVLVGAGKVEGQMKELKVKSIYTADDLFIRFEWPDDDKSMNKNRWRYTGDKWVKMKGDEDRIGVVWEINRIDKFATKGCAILCHSESKNNKEWYFSVNSEREKGDLWHWKAVRSNPVGYTEDGYLIANPTKQPEKGRKRDAGSDTKAKSNRNKDKSKPTHMQNPSHPASIAGSLLVAEAVAINDYSGFKEGAEIPGYMLYTDWKDSFADIQTQGVWEGGKWTVMMKRKLRTDQDDDVQFNTRKKYPFAIAVFDNEHNEDSYDSDPLKLQFE